MRTRTRAYWVDVTGNEWQPIDNHAAAALADPVRYRLSRRDVAKAMAYGASFIARRPAIIAVVIAHGFVRTRLTAYGKLIVQADIVIQRDAVRLVVIGMVERHQLRIHARCDLQQRTLGQEHWDRHLVLASHQRLAGSHP